MIMRVSDGRMKTGFTEKTVRRRKRKHIKIIITIAVESHTRMARV